MKLGGLLTANDNHLSNKKVFLGHLAEQSKVTLA